MNLVHAALLLHSAGKEINEEGVKKLADATGEKVEDAQVKALVAALDGVDIEDAISKAVAAPVAAAPTATADSGDAEEKEEEKEAKQEEKAEEAAAGLGSLFG